MGHVTEQLSIASQDVDVNSRIGACSGQGACGSMVPAGGPCREAGGPCREAGHCLQPPISPLCSSLKSERETVCQPVPPRKGKMPLQGLIDIGNSDDIAPCSVYGELKAIPHKCKSHVCPHVEKAETVANRVNLQNTATSLCTKAEYFSC